MVYVLAKMLGVMLVTLVAAVLTLLFVVYFTEPRK